MHKHANCLLIVLLICQARAGSVAVKPRGTFPTAGDLSKLPLLNSSPERVNIAPSLYTADGQPVPKFVRRHVRTGLRDMGLFVNATTTTVCVDSEIPGGGSVGSVVRPNESVRLEVMGGGQVTVSNWSSPQVPKPILFMTTLKIPHRRPNDQSHRQFRLVVHERKLEVSGP